jgi:hypothetical protein
MSAMHDFIERQNIAHFIEQINAETDPAKRAVIIKLLSDEEAKLASHNRKNSRLSLWPRVDTD